MLQRSRRVRREGLPDSAYDGEPPHPAAVLAGRLLDTLAGWWRADSVAGLVIVYDAVREALTIFRNVR
ncbi:hypothetical protein [Arthrobacter sp. fls2-241-R2A-200]|uniref:hypothetical protein n=1 Tax=Arthrobacter sp. fls2-241-R2A-200 TaxID=3040281 RepID=UPI00254C58E6|nr:hypothetical protein [Arthrobacter sp. fls2-241-R2A-200]